MPEGSFCHIHVIYILYVYIYIFFWTPKAYDLNSTNVYVVDNQKNHLNEMVILSTQNKF